MWQVPPEGEWNLESEQSHRTRHYHHYPGSSSENSSKPPPRPHALPMHVASNVEFTTSDTSFASSYISTALELVLGLWRFERPFTQVNPHPDVCTRLGRHWQRTCLGLPQEATAMKSPTLLVCGVLLDGLHALLCTRPLSSGEGGRSCLHVCDPSRLVGIPVVPGRKFKIERTI